MTLSTSVFVGLLVCLFGSSSCTTNDTQDPISSKLETLISSKLETLISSKLETLISSKLETFISRMDTFFTILGEFRNTIRGLEADMTCIKESIKKLEERIDHVDECSSNVCGAEQICSNSAGNYSCTCDEGYHKQGDNCPDINECESDMHSCSANATCINTKGNYTCQCLPYYYGNGFTCNDCQTELNKRRKALLDELHTLGVDHITPASEKNLIKALEEKEPQCVRRSNCKELLDNGNIRSGVYTITPEGFPDGVQVYCDQETNGGGWTVILQRQRQSQQVNFVRTFEEYAAGFGDPNGEIWIGNRLVHAMTRDEPFTLRVDAKNLQGESRTGIWNTFSVGSQDTQFTLSIAGYSSSSTLGDALTNPGKPGDNANGMMFSTYDRDNDKSGSSCSGMDGKGGWWYNSCTDAHSTAPLGDKDDTTRIAHWEYWESSSSGRRIALSAIQFKIRPSK